MNNTIELTPQQGQEVVLNHCMYELIMMKQYLTEKEKAHYMYFIKKYGTVTQIEEYSVYYGKAWPNSEKKLFEDLL